MTEDVVDDFILADLAFRTLGWPSWDMRATDCHDNGSSLSLVFRWLQLPRFDKKSLSLFLLPMMNGTRSVLQLAHD